MNKASKLESFDYKTTRPNPKDMDVIRINIELEFDTKKKAYYYLNNRFNKLDDGDMNRMIYQTLSEYIWFDMKFEDFCRL